MQSQKDSPQKQQERQRAGKYEPCYMDSPTQLDRVGEKSKEKEKSKLILGF